MGHPRPQFRAKADLPVGFPYRFNSRKWHTHTYPDVRSIRYAVVKKKKKKKKKNSDSNPSPSSTYFLTWWLSLICFIFVQLLLHWYLLFEFPASALSLRSADNVGRPFCCCIVFSLLLRSADNVGRPFCCCIVFSLLFFFYFFSFPLTAFCDFSAIFHRISLIFGQLVDNNL